MSRKKIDIMDITDIGEINHLKDMDFIKCGVPAWVVKEGDCESVFYEMLDYVFIFKELRKVSTCEYLDSLFYMKMFDLIYPLILLAYKIYLGEYKERLSLRSENEKLRKEIKSNGCQ